MVWTLIGSIVDIPRRGARCVETPQGRIAVFRTIEDRVFAIEDRCPHKGGPLSQGIVHGAAVTCPLHNWVISLETGKALGADEGEVRTIPVKVEGEKLFVCPSTRGRPRNNELGVRFQMSGKSNGNIENITARILRAALLRHWLEFLPGFRDLGSISRAAPYRAAFVKSYIDWRFIQNSAEPPKSFP